MIESSAVFSEDGRYRYRLERKWANEGPGAIWVMLNPSTANAREDDPTIRRCVSFSKQRGCGHLVVVNLFALVTPSPEELFRVADIEERVGPENRRHVDRAVEQAVAMGDLVIVAWGANGVCLPGVLTSMERFARKGARCFGFTKNGQPRHPLYLPNSAPLLELRDLLLEERGVHVQ